MKRLAVFLVLLVALGTRAHAMLPESGWWWNPDESGSGFNIEIQDNKLFVALFSYQAGGASTWYSASGTMTGDNRFSGSLYAFTGGQCLTCAYTPPATSAAVGTISITFQTPSTATLTINGSRTIAVERIAFGVNPAAPRKMFGEWAIVSGSISFPVYFGERIQFDDTYTSSDGTVSATGNRAGDFGEIAVSMQHSDGSWSILLDSSMSYYQYFNFTFSGLNVIEGRNWTYLKASSLSGSGLPFIGFRSRSARAVANGDGPGVSTRAVTPDEPHVDRSGLDARVASLGLEAADAPTSPEDLARFAEVRQLMEERLVERGARRWIPATAR